jgi:hypothetical protein
MLLVLLTGLVAVGGCDGKAKIPEVPFDPDQAAQKFSGITYRRTGGLAGSEDRIAIAPGGKIETSGRFLGKREGQASSFQLAQLDRLLEGWGKLQSEYPAPAGAADAFLTEVEFGGKKVTASDANSQVPVEFKRVKDRLEAIVQPLKPAN